MAWHSPIFCSFPRETNIPLKTQKVQGLFTFSAPRNRNRMTIKLFFLFNQWLSIRSFGRRVIRSYALQSHVSVGFTFRANRWKRLLRINSYCVLKGHCLLTHLWAGGARWLSGRVSDSGARGPGFETYLRRVVSLSKTLYSPKVLVNYPGSDGSVPTWLKNCWLGR